MAVPNAGFTGVHMKRISVGLLVGFLVIVFATRHSSAQACWQRRNFQGRGYDNDVVVEA
jgi:hypothetical protein